MQRPRNLGRRVDSRVVREASLVRQRVGIDEESPSLLKCLRTLAETRLVERLEAVVDGRESILDHPSAP